MTNIKHIKNDIEAIQFLEGYCDFTDPNHVWIMKGIARNKDNPDNSIKFMRRMVLTCKEDIQEIYYDIKHQMLAVHGVYRIYISLNARDAVKSLFNFQKRMVDINTGLFKNTPDALAMSKKIGSLWKTEMEQSSNRGTKRFLLDIDNCECDEFVSDIADRVEEWTDKIHCVNKTVSGYAIVFNACDTREIVEYLKILGAEYDLHKDSMLFIDQFIVN